MNNYLKLVNFEINRFFKLYVILIGITIVSQLIGVVVVSKAYLEQAKRIMFQDQLSFSEFIARGYNNSPFQQFMYSGYVMFSIFMCIIVLVMYVFFIWYRDWFAKNTFIYRLLQLPTNRLTIYFAKMSAIMLFVFGLITLQLILIPIEFQMIKSIVPADYRADISIYEPLNTDIWAMMYPKSFIAFIMNYGMGIIFVAVLFTAILIERSFRLKGIFIAVIYGVLSFVVFMVPILLMNQFPNYLYPLELFIIALLTSSIVLGASIWLASYLLKHKITV